MSLTMFCKLLMLLGLLATDTCSKRISRSPKYLFSSDSNSLDELPEGAFAVSEDPSERLGSSSEKVEERYSRVRRSSDVTSSVPSPHVTPSRALCDHNDFYIQWTAESLTSNGALVALCRDGKDKGLNMRTPLVFVSNDHGLNWKNVTDKFINDTSSSTISIENYYTVKEKPNFIVFADVKNRKIFYTNDGLNSVTAVKVEFEPKDISINPENQSLIIASNDTHIYLSKDGSQTYNLVEHFGEVYAFYWGSKKYGDKETDIFVEGRAIGKSNTQGYKVDCSQNCNQPEPLTDEAPLNGVIEDFLVKNEYMFCTKKKTIGDLDLYVKYTRSGEFVKANIQATSPMREFFVYDVSGGVVMLVVNHRKNETNLYTSVGRSGTSYSLSLPRVLYHNPGSDVSSHWLRKAVSYRFVDILKVESLPWVYFATQLTIGPVGARYLISMMTFDKGGFWKRVRGPRKNKYRRFCYYPTCSLHVNLFYGSIYRYSKTTPLMSRASAPGLIMTTGVLGTNLKITPDTYISRNGGKSFDLVLNGKKRFAFGDHGGIVVATEFRETNVLQYSYDFQHFSTVRLFKSAVSRNVVVKKILTEPGDKSAVFLLVAQYQKKWMVFLVNATETLGSPCTKNDYHVVNVTDVGVDGCAVQQIQQRNASKRCLMGTKHSHLMKTSYKKCFCRRQNYRCDYQFEPTSYGGCRMSDGATLVPVNCPEGQTYNRSQGFVKIQGHDCVDDNLTRMYFTPVETPCPVKQLVGLRVATKPARINGVIPLTINQTTELTANLTIGYLPHVNFTWHWDSHHLYSGFGSDHHYMSISFDKALNTKIYLTASNGKSSLLETISIAVQRIINKTELQLVRTPILPSVGEEVNFIVEFLNVDKAGELGNLEYKWIIGTGHPKETKTISPFFKAVFNTTGQKKVTVSVSNLVSSCQLSLKFEVTKDMQVKNVKLRNINHDLLVSWDPVKEPLYDIQRYRVMYKKATDAVFLEANCPKDGQCFIANVSSYTVYYVTVDVVTKAGYVVPSKMKNIRTSSSIPSVPTKVKFVVEGPVKVVASWEAPKSPNGVITQYKYKFYQKLQDTKPFVVSDSNRSITFDNLKSDEDYHFEVAAVNGAGQGPYSEAISVRTGMGKPVLPPSNVQVVERSATSVELVWKPPKIKNGSSILFSPKGYNIYIVTKSGKKFLASTPENRYTFTGLKPFTNYTVAISAYVSQEEGPLTRKRFNTSLGTPDPPAELKVSNYSSTSASFSWIPKGDFRLISSYELYQLSPPTTKPLTKVYNTKATVKQLAPYTKYVFAVKAVNEYYKSSYSNNVTLTTKEDKPGAPASVNVVDRWPQSSSVKLSWEPPSTPNGIITKYKVKWYISSNKNDFKEVEVSENNFLAIDHLRQETKYRFDVMAYTKIGSGPTNHMIFTTHFYPYGSQHIIIPFKDPNTAERLLKKKTFEEEFVHSITYTTGIRKERIADIQLNKEDNSVEFELISKEELHSETSEKILEEMEKVKAMLRRTIKVSGAFTKANALKSTQQHQGLPSSKGSATSSNNMVLIVGVICGFVVIIVILVIALVLLFRRYRKKRLYDKFDNNQFYYNHDQDSIHGDDDGVEMRPPSKYRNKDSDTIPLADADELT